MVKKLFNLSLKSILLTCILVFLLCVSVMLKIVIYSCVIAIPLFFSDFLFGTSVFAWKYTLFGGIVAHTVTLLAKFLERLGD